MQFTRICHAVSISIRPHFQGRKSGIRAVNDTIMIVVDRTKSRKAIG